MCKLLPQMERAGQGSRIRETPAGPFAAGGPGLPRNGGVRSEEAASRPGASGPGRRFRLGSAFKAGRFSQLLPT